MFYSVYYAEECKIDAVKAKMLKKLVDNLCTVWNEEFINYYFNVEKDVFELKRRNKTALKDMYKHWLETMSRYLKRMNVDAEYNNPILWQVWTAPLVCFISCVTKA